MNTNRTISSGMKNGGVKMIFFFLLFVVLFG